MKRNGIDKAFAVAFAWLIVFIMLVSTTAFFQGCAATLSQKRAVLGIADWYVVNHALLTVEFRTAEEAENVDHLHWLWENVAKPMNLMKYGILGLDAVGEDNTENMAVAANGILRWAEVDWDSTKLVMAIQTKDYDTIQVELLSLKSYIIARWLTSKEG